MFSLLTERYEENDCLVSGFAVGLACACSIMILPSVLLGSESTIITDTNRTLLLATATCATTNAIVYTSIWGSPAVEKAHNASRSLLSQLLDGLFFVILGVPFLYIMFVSFGAPLVDKIESTLACSLFISVLTYMPLGITCGIDVEQVKALCMDRRWRNAQEMLVYVGLVGVHAGLWLGAIAVPLDWDRPWQPWPISSVIAGVCVFSVSVCAYASVSTTRWSPSTWQKRKAG